MTHAPTIPAGRKLLLAAAVVGLGLLLAWPMRRNRPAADSPVSTTRQTVVAEQSSPPTSAPTAVQEESFDIADHPAIRGHESFGELPTAANDLPPRPLTPAVSLHKAVTERPAPRADVKPPVEPEVPTNWPEEREHVVHNGDTLESLSERYLGDPLRSLEIFELNRDVLTNPHLLPIGAVLRIPAVEEDRL